MVGGVAQRLGVAQVGQRPVEARIAVERHQVRMRLDGRDEAVQLVLEDRPIDARRCRHLADRDRRQRLARVAPAREARSAAGGIDALEPVVVQGDADAGRQLRELAQAPGPFLGGQACEARVGVVDGGRHRQASLRGRVASFVGDQRQRRLALRAFEHQSRARTRSWPWPTCCCTSLISCTNLGTVSRRQQRQEPAVERVGCARACACVAPTRRAARVASRTGAPTRAAAR